MKIKILYLFIACIISNSGVAQPDEDKLGAWYMYFFTETFGDSKFGVQGDLQYRNWNLGGDLEQLLVRSGLTYQATDNALLTLGYGNITTGQFGDDDATVSESRIYQEALLGHKISDYVRLKHRFRYEQRWVENQDFRTRYRYNLFLTIPLSSQLMSQGAFYLAFYNELFINGGRDIGDGLTVELFDRNRLYGALGYVLSERYKLQLGMMKQSTDNWSKNQLQLSVHASY